MLDLRQNTRAHTAKIADWDEKDQNNLLNQSIELYISIFEWAGMYGTVKAEMVCTQVRSSSYVFLSYGDNVKIYMQMMDLKSYRKVKKI